MIGGLKGSVYWCVWGRVQLRLCNIVAELVVGRLRDRVTDRVWDSAYDRVSGRAFEGMNR